LYAIQTAMLEGAMFLRGFFRPRARLQAGGGFRTGGVVAGDDPAPLAGNGDVGRRSVDEVFKL